MNILIIEDDQNKVKQIIEHITSVYEVINIIKKHSYQSGLKEIINNKKKYDLILLDMSMPTFDISHQETGGRLRPFAGKDILRQMYRKKITIPTIIVTQFETFGEITESITLSQLTDELKSNYAETYLGTVYYNAVQKNWQDDLIAIMNKIQR